MIDSLPLGIGISTASLVGNSLGAGLKPLAMRLSRLSIYLILLMEVGLGLTVLYGGDSFADLFTNDETVKHIAHRAVPFLALFAMVDGVQGVASGVLRGSGKQALGAIANVIAFYAIGLPMSWHICFIMKMGVVGLIMGLSFGACFQTVVLLILIFCFPDYVFSVVLPTARISGEEDAPSPLLEKSSSVAEYSQLSGRTDAEFGSTAESCSDGDIQLT